MKIMTKFFALGSVALSALLLSVAASATTVVCPEDNTGNQLEFSNTSGGPPTCAGAWNEPNENSVDFFDDLTLLWKIDFDGEGGVEGTSGTGPNPFISFTGGDERSGSLELIAGLRDHVISFKFGSGQTDPSLFAFDVNGMTAADWALLPRGEGNALSHVAIWGPPVEVPAPGTLALLGMGLVALAFRARRRRVV